MATSVDNATAAAGARAHFERALTIFERALGEDHPKTHSVRESLDALG